MKKIKGILLMLMAIVIFACKKEKESSTNCSEESILTDVSYTSTPGDSKQINFVVTYRGTHTIDNNVKWDFGDGTPLQTVNALTTNHVYSGAGTFVVKVIVTLNDGACSYDLEESVIVQ